MHWSIHNLRTNTSPCSCFACQIAVFLCKPLLVSPPSPRFANSIQSLPLHFVLVHQRCQWCPLKNVFHYNNQTAFKVVTIQMNPQEFKCIELIPNPSLGSSSSISIAHSVLRSAGPHQKKKTIQLNPPTAACKIRAAGSVWVGAGGAVSPVRCGVSALRSPGDRRRETGGGGGGSAALVLGGSWRSGFLLLLPCPDPLLPPSPSSFSRRHKNRVAERERAGERECGAERGRAGPEGVWAAPCTLR